MRIFTEQYVMDVFILALGVLGLTAVLLAAACLAPQTELVRKTIHMAAPAGIVTGCICGLWAVITGPWAEVAILNAGWGLPSGSGRLALDAVSRVFLLPVFGLGAVCAVSGAASLTHCHGGHHNMPAHWLFYTLLILALAVVMTARDCVLFLIAWEVMSLSPFFLIEFDDHEAGVREASLTYLIAAHLGAVVLLGFFALAWHAGGSSTAFFGGIAADTPFAGALFVLAVIGFGAKAGLAPMHIWLPEAHPAAPSHVSALLSGAMINAGLYGIFRTVTLIGPMNQHPAWWGWSLLFLGLGTALTGIFKATAQNNLKRLLAYSSVENMGIMLMGLGTGLVGGKLGQPVIAGLGFGACLLHMLNHAAFKGLLFLCAGEVLHAVQTVRLELLGGLQKKMPLVGTVFAVGAASIICLPPLNGFMSEFLLALGLASGVGLPGMEQQIGLLLPLVGLALVSGLAAVTFAKAYGTAFLGEPRTGLAADPHLPSKASVLPLLLPAAACVGLGLFAPQVFQRISTAIPAAGASLWQPDAVITETLSAVVRAGLICIFLTGGLILLRRRLLNGRIRRHKTWGCGFQAPTARIQYTDASFIGPETELFGRLMGVQTRRNMDEGYFPGRAGYTADAPDGLRNKVYVPLFDAVKRFCDACKIIQSGRIHIYIMYMLATLVVLLAWGVTA